MGNGGKGGSGLKVRVMETRENELRDAELLVVVVVCQRSPTRSQESLDERSAIVSTLRFVESRLLELRCVELRLALLS